jgi:hypothetical protein
MPKTFFMRRLFTTAIGLAAGFWLLTGWLGTAVNADTPVVVLPASPVILHLPPSPSVNRVVSDLHLELRSVAAATADDRIGDAVARIEVDDDLLREVAVAPVEMFDSGAAAATATAVYDIQITPERVTVVVVTVELVPAYGSTASSREHEDGHALINRSLARRCAATALRHAVESGYRGESLVNSMVAYLVESSDPVHQTYHQYAEYAIYGQHMAHAERAIADVSGCADF